MGTNENLQQINTFIKGMNTDVSDMMLDPQQYRYAENLRLITDSNSNSGELRVIEGVKDIYNFSDHTPAYIGYIRGYVVAIIYRSTDWSIQISKDNGESWNYIFEKCKDKIWKDGDVPHISAVLNYEADDKIKLYFVDDTGKHGIMSINITKGNIGNNIKSIMGNVERVPEPPSIRVSEASGSLDTSRVQYAYRLYNEFGSASNVSVLSTPLSIYKTGGEGYGKIRQTNAAVDIDIKYSLSFYNKVEIYRIAYYDIGQLPRVFLIREIDYTKDISITDIGQYKHELSVEEFLALDNTETNPKVIENKNNYLFAANLSYAKDIVDQKFDTWKAVSKSSGMTDSGDFYTHSQFSNGYRDYDERWWHPDGEVTGIGGNGVHINWRLYKIDNRISRNKNNANKNTYHGFKHNETYRFGIILYDEDKRASSVKWIADIRIPELDPKNDIEIINHEEFNYKTYGVEFTVKDLPTGCSGYEIVRCDRKISDKHVVFQGIVGTTMDQTTIKKDIDLPLFPHTSRPEQSITQPYIYPSGLITLQSIFATQHSSELTYHNDIEYTYANSSRKYLQFACPEYCYLPDSSKDLLESYKYSVRLELSHTFNTHFEDKSIDGEYNNKLQIFTSDRSDILPYGWVVTDNDEYSGTHEGYYIFVEPKIMHDNIDSMKGYVQQELINAGVAPSGSNVHCNYVVPKEIAETNPFTKPTTFTDITDIAYCTAPKWNEFASEENYIYRDAVTVIGGKQFINWSTPLINDKKLSDMNEPFKGGDYNWSVPKDWDPNRMYYPIGSGGSCILLEMKDREQYQYTTSKNLAPISIANIVKDCVPYGGYTKDAVEDSVYYSYGDYKSSAGTIRVASGDCYPGIFVYNALHVWEDPIFICATKMSTIYSVPIESDIDLSGQSGYQYHSNIGLDFCIQDEACSIPDFNYTQEQSSYAYNNVYHIQPTVKSFTYQKLIESNYDTRVHHSNVKEKNEYIDNWLRYKPMNYIDCDSKYGQITQVDNFKDTLLFWQDKATGIISSNERNIIQNTDGVNLMLGNGDMLQRYDYITTIYGMKYGQFANAQSDNSEYWWDGANKEILQYTKSGIPTPISTTKGVKKYVEYGTENTKPHVTYDNKYKELIFSVVDNQSISYTEQLQTFQSIYNFKIELDTLTDNDILVASSKYLSLLDKCYKDGYSASFGKVELLPKLKLVVNKNSVVNKVFDIQTFGGRMYGGDDLKDLRFKFDTPLKQHGEIKGDRITNREYDFRLAVPRHNNSEYGDRLRGKTMQCELSSKNNSTDFSLQYIITKYRISWS